MLNNLYTLNNDMQTQPFWFIIHTQLNNMIEYTSRVEVEAAIVLYVAGRHSRNVNIDNLLINLENTYGREAVIDAAQLMGFCVLNKAI